MNEKNVLQLCGRNRGFVYLNIEKQVERGGDERINLKR